MLLLLGSWGTWKLLRSENRTAGVMLASASIVLFLLAYFGSLIPFVKGWQPLRFKVPLDLLMVLATSYIVVDGLSSAPRPGLTSLPALLACGALGLFL